MLQTGTRPFPYTTLFTESLKFEISCFTYIELACLVVILRDFCVVGICRILRCAFVLGAARNYRFNLISAYCVSALGMSAYSTNIFSYNLWSYHMILI